MLDCTVIIPVYVVHEAALGWLKECLNSAFVQNCAVVAYVDGSPIDPTPVLTKYKKLVYDVGTTNHGVSYARNRACTMVKTKFILPLDCDDKLKPGAVRSLMDVWDGVPVYPDVAKFGDVNEPHYALLDFDCTHLLNHVGFTSVNVLHTLAQHEAIGGWDEDIHFYEDGEYNARLLGKYCGQRYSAPLVDYRIHPDQRTNTLKAQSASTARELLTRIRSYTMPCSSCSKRKAEIKYDVPAPGNSAPVGLPGEKDGTVLVQYIGGQGKAPHYYQGPVTKYAYRVEYGDYLYVDPRDARTTEQPPNKSFFVRHVPTPEPEPPAAPPATPAPEPEPTVTRQGRAAPKRQPQ